MLHPLAAHRAVFLLGDMNMRLSRPESFASWTAWRAHVLNSIQVEQMEPLVKQDQLRNVVDDREKMLYVVSNPSKGLETAAKRSARTLREPTPHGEGPPFPPTYKLAVPGPGYAARRVPAWTDRVLFRGGDVKPLRYRSIRQQEFFRPPRNLTDHDPVYALFEVDCVRVNKGVLQVHVQRALLKAGGRHSERMQHMTDEQERHFRWRFVNTGRPHIELLAHRVFDLLREELRGPELTLAADKLVSAQQQCWRLVCDCMEEQLQETLHKKHDSSAAQALEDSLHEISKDLKDVLERHVKHERTDSSAKEPPPEDSGPDAKQPDPGYQPKPTTERPPRHGLCRRRRVCILCWAPCYKGFCQGRG